MESRAKLNLILEDALSVIKTPAEFYRAMPRTGGFSDPIIFILVMAVVMGLVVAVFSLFGAGVIGAMAAGLGAIITIPIFALIGSFISAAFLFVIWKLMGSSQKYETAYRCTAYAAAIYPIIVVLGLIPYIGTIVGIAWGIYLMINASVEVHQLERKKSSIVFGILGALLLVSNVSSEMAARKMAQHAEKYGEQFENLGEQFEGVNEMTPKEAGEALGGFIEGLNKAAQEANQAGQHGAESTSAGSDEALSAEDSAALDKTMTAEDAGKALGDFFSGLEKATREMREQAEAQNGDGSATASGIGAATDAESEK